MKRPNVTTKRPDIVKDMHLEYLDDLREGGSINMMGAALPLRQTFSELSRDDANVIVGYWMASFGGRHA